jgi:hypothetical protein
MNHNPLHEIIYDKVVKPAFDKLSHEAEGIVTKVNYMAQTVDVRWRDHQKALFRAQDVPLPKDADGVFKQALEIGQRVKLGFTNNDHMRPFVSIVYSRHSSSADYHSKNGAPIMKGTNYILGGG